MATRRFPNDFSTLSSSAPQLQFLADDGTKNGNIGIADLAAFIQGPLMASIESNATALNNSIASGITTSSVTTDVLLANGNAFAQTFGASSAQISALGTTQATARQLVNAFNLITSSLPLNNGVILPSFNPNSTGSTVQYTLIMLVNEGVSPTTVYAAGTGTINGSTTPITLPPGFGIVIMQTAAAGVLGATAPAYTIVAGMPYGAAWIQVNSQSASYTLQASDLNGLVLMGNTAAANITLPSPSLLGAEPGDQIAIVLTTTNALTVTPNAGIALNGVTGVAGAYSITVPYVKATLTCLSSTSWMIDGGQISGLSSIQTLLSSLATSPTGLSVGQWWNNEGIPQQVQ